jgi:putative component of membrane protein insertase Oxa1/YidC/SpoIIIJ protein YidD
MNTEDAALVWARMMQLTDQTALGVLEQYQRRVSPYKGFCCPAGRVYGDSTCSAVLKRIVREQGVLAGLPQIHAQLLRCREAAQQLSLLPSPAWPHPQAAVFCCVLPIPL